jgi:ankyrin repeat protein
VRLLVSAGTEVNARNRSGLIPLRSLVRHNNLELVELLLRHGADPNHGRVLHLAASLGRLPMVRLLLEREARADGGGGGSPVAVAKPRVKVYLLEHRRR